MSRAQSEITHVFFDIGGVLGTNGWDSAARALATGRFHLGSEFEERHEEVVGDWEVGAIDWEEYLDVTVFDEPRNFSRDDFKAFMLEQSRPFPESVALAERLAAGGKVLLFTLNNESEALNRYRIEHFGLRGLFAGFLSSCWLGFRKPSRKMFSRSLAITQAEADRSLFIDDRPQNLAPARRLGMRTVRYADPGELEAALEAWRLL